MAGEAKEEEKQQDDTREQGGNNDEEVFSDTRERVDEEELDEADREDEEEDPETPPGQGVQSSGTFVFIKRFIEKTSNG